MYGYSQELTSGVKIKDLPPPISLLPDEGLSAPEETKRLFIEHNMYIKHCQGKTMQDDDHYIRIASHTKTENSNLVNALVSIIGYKRC